MKKIDLGVIVTTLIIVTISCSLAFFAARVVGEPKDINLVAKNVAITFNDTSIIANGVVSPGWNTTKTFTITNNSKEEYKYNISIKDLINTFVTEGYLQYKITSTNDGYNMTEFKDIPKSSVATDTILAYSVSIPVGVTQSYTIEFKYANDESIDQSDDMGKKLSGTLFITEGTEQPTLLSQILNDNPTRSTRSNNNNGTNDFATTLTTTTTGTLFTSTESITGITDTPKEVYYYAGNTTNNWVKFANIYWRIIRTNHDSSIRLLYVGTSHDTTTGNIGTSAFNSSYYSPKYAGYKYGEDTSLDTIRNNTTDSTIKTVIDSWYQNNLTNYTKYLSTSAVYCNDRNLGTGQTYSASSNFNFASYYRLDYAIDGAKAGAKANPSYNCTDIRDAFSVENTSAKLDYPVSLMTADEIAFAGGVAYKTMNTPYAWFISNSAGKMISGWWWSLSPFNWDGSRGVSAWFWNAVNNFMYDVSVRYHYAVRPVISLKGDLIWKSGDGSSASPYEVEDLPPTLAETIKTHATSHTNGVYNENGYRYEGTDPNNYIYMTNKSTNKKERWRIIGVFNDGANGEEVIRVRRHYEKNSYPTMAYDTNQANHFPNTTMYSALSSTYNLTNYNHTVNYKMHLGTSSSWDSLTSSGWYTAERGTTPGATAANSYNNSVSFIGSVGLIYPSDYGYAVLASDCARTEELYNYSGTAACYNNNWLYQGNVQYQWLISPSAFGTIAAFDVGKRGLVWDDEDVTINLASSPVMALSNDILVSGSGTYADPYTITN